MLRSGKTIAGSESGIVESKPKRVRAATRMSDVHDILDGDVRLFRTTHSGDVWQMRMWVTEFERNGRDHEIHRRPVAASELSSANGGPFVERHQIVSGDPLDITAAAKHLGDQMMERLPGGSVDEANQLAKTEFGAIAQQMSDTSLSSLYKAYLDQPHLVQASEPMGSVSMQVESSFGPSDQAENRTFWQQAKPRAQPFTWGLGAVEVMFEVIGKEMTGRGLTVESEPELKAITDTARYPESAEQPIVNCIGTGTPVDNAVANLRSTAPPPGALRA